MRPAHGEPAGRRLGHPQVLADLHAEGEERLLITAEHGVGHDRDADRLPSRAYIYPGELAGDLSAGGKMALLVKLRVIRQMLLRHESQHLAPAEHGRAVIELAAQSQRQADKQHGVELRRLAPDRLQRVERAVEKRVLQKQVAAGVAREAELREHDKARAVRRRFRCSGDDRRGVVSAAGYLDARRCGRYFDESVSHLFSPP